MKQSLSIEQSARLIELGIPENISTFCYCKNMDNPDEEYPTLFNLVDLLSILPKKVSDRRKIFELRMGVCDRLGGGECWYIKYVNPFLDTDELDSFQSAEELIDAVYEEIVFLKSEKDIVWL